MEKVTELKTKGICFVVFANIAAFLDTCKMQGIIPNGGAISIEQHGQWFYMDR